MEKNGNYEIVKSLDLGFLTMEVTYSVNQTGGLHKFFLSDYLSPPSLSLQPYLSLIIIMSFLLISY